MEVKSEFAQMSRQDIESHIINRATADAEFRASLIADPRAALEQEIGLSVPADFTLTVIEETANSMSLVLPPAQGELSDMELEGVAGGKGESSGVRPMPRPGAGVASQGGGNIVAQGGGNMRR